MSSPNTSTNRRNVHSIAKLVLSIGWPAKTFGEQKTLLPATPLPLPQNHVPNSFASQNIFSMAAHGPSSDPIVAMSSPHMPMATSGSFPITAPRDPPSLLSEKRLWATGKCPINYSTLSNRPEKVDS
ncbi:hypothetical protein KY284_030308 [Solanum tuberosum]|nr:hypothetical protein KY284_030308 [Solanum tuberosum]